MIRPGIQQYSECPVQKNATQQNWIRPKSEKRPYERRPSCEDLDRFGDGERVFELYSEVSGRLSIFVWPRSS